MLQMEQTFRVEVASVVRVTGEIDVASAPELENALGIVPAESGTVVVDLSAVTFMDSTGLGVLVAAWNRYNSQEPVGRLALVVSTPEVERLLEVTGLAEVFGTFPTLGDALTG